MRNSAPFLQLNTKATNNSDFNRQTWEPTHEILALFVLLKFILQIRMRSHPVRLDVWFLAWPFVYFYSSCVRTAKALARLRGCTASPEPSQVAYAICTIISWAGSWVVSRWLMPYEIDSCLQLVIFMEIIVCRRSMWPFGAKIYSSDRNLISRCSRDRHYIAGRLLLTQPEWKMYAK